jgi:hypothetical protein
MTVLISGAVLEVLWTVYLGWRLPYKHTAYHWDVAWVGLDVAEIAMLLGAAWAAWRRRALLILFAILDAWFDVTTSGKSGFNESLTLAVLVEVPSAIALLWVARRAAHVLLTTEISMAHLAEKPLREIPLTPKSHDL